MTQIRYNFIIPPSPDYSLSILKSGSHLDFTHFYNKGEYIWTLQTYYILREMGLSVNLSLDWDPQAVNLTHGNTARRLNNPCHCFCVSIQADFDRFPLADLHIVQNKAQSNKNSFFIPHWSQPKQMSRDPSRQGVKKVAYQGNLDFTDLNTQQLNSDLNPHGIEFELLGPTQWSDLSEVDILVGVRSFGKKKFNRKPATKLINSWIAHIPFIGGWDTAYSQIGSPGRNYLKVSSYEELIQSILKLKYDHKLYSRLANAGLQKGLDYNLEATATKWLSLLKTDIATVFENWQEHPPSTLNRRWKYLRHTTNDFVKKSLRNLYCIPAIKRFRDRYYDPQK